MLSVTSPAQRKWWLWVESNHQPFAYETKALPFELHSQMQNAGRIDPGGQGDIHVETDKIGT